MFNFIDIVSTRVALKYLRRKMLILLSLFQIWYVSHQDDFVCMIKR